MIMSFELSQRLATVSQSHSTDRSKNKHSINQYEPIYSW